MMTNLFSIFDPASPNSLSANWCSSLLFVLLMPGAQWVASTRYSGLFKQLSDYLFSEFRPIVKKASFVLLISVSLLLLIMFNNVAGLLPYIFTATAHLSFSLCFGLAAWSGLMLYGWSFNTQALLVHLIPQGTPAALMPFMVVIESISNIIRPGTLAVRLSANMIAGHLLLSLLSSSFSFSPLMAVPILAIAELALISLECAVAFIQSYVFSVLLTLYMAEFSD
ncbi:ATP synthase F0 subunit 6 (mitochondrion) [Hyalella azteca]|uniref:ATP synthase subunit a n=1 Tax=Hyalella azteca TaxID=294128 RepID=A0A385UMD3_HYAAZ|nr:ATP synthase F0 subunit 6 [Hyalella azteca]AYB71619.1 ATP synthase F0 subunit 6 [Hyalella azteca]